MWAICGTATEQWKATFSPEGQVPWLVKGGYAKNRCCDHQRLGNVWMNG